MKRIIPLMAIALLLISCGKTGTYKQAITDFIEVHNGVRTDCEVKIADLEKEKDVTAADSISIIRAWVDYDRGIQVLDAEQTLDRIKKYGPDGPGIGYGEPETLESAQAKLEKARTKDYPGLHFYEGRDTTDVLAVIVTGKVALTHPVIKSKQESTETFLLTPDGRKVIKRLVKRKDRSVE